jgi:prophage DNA circulation protein
MDRSTGELVHPLYGTIQCKPSEWKASLNADERGGQFVDITFIETRDDGVTPAFSTRESAYAQTVAADLDSQLAALVPSPVVFTANDDATSFLDVVLQLSRVVDGATLHARQALAKVDGTIAKLDRLAGSIDRAADVVTVDATSGLTKTLGKLGAGSGRIWTNTQALRSALVDVRLRLGTSSSRTVRTTSFAKPTMLVVIASRLGSTTAEILALNPAISRARPTVPANTLIRYFAQT